MGLLCTTIHRHEVAPAYPQTVTHRHETPPEVIARMEEWREALKRDLVAEKSPDNSLVDMKVMFDASRNEYRIGFRLNGKQMYGVVSKAEMLTAHAHRQIAVAVAESVVRCLS